MQILSMRPSVAARCFSLVSAWCFCSLSMVGCSPKESSPAAPAADKLFTLEILPVTPKKVGEKFPLICGIVKHGDAPLFVEVTTIRYPVTHGIHLKYDIIPSNPPVGGYWSPRGSKFVATFGMRFFALMTGGYRELDLPVTCGPFDLAGKVLGKMSVDLTYCGVGETEFQKCTVERDFEVEISEGERVEESPSKAPVRARSRWA